MKVKTSKKYIWLRIAAICFVLLLGVEVALRLMGAIDFPIYYKDKAIGYVPSANQQGQFLNKNSWVLNARSLGTSKSWPKDAENKINIMLVGDSVVWGGNPLNQPDKMGDQLNHKLGEEYVVWPASAGGWSAANEIEMVRRNQDVYEQSDKVIWVLNSGDLTSLAVSSQQENVVHPSSKPWSAIYYYIQKILLPKFGVKIGTENPAIDTNVGVDNKVLLALEDKINERVKQNKPVIIVLYPDVNEVKKSKIEGYQKLINALQPMCHEKYVQCIDLIKKPQWNEHLYRDGIHPSVEGNRIIAQVLSEYVQH